MSAVTLKSRRLQLATLRMHDIDPVLLRRELTEKVASAPELLRYAPVLLDLTAVQKDIEDAGPERVIVAVRAAGLVPCGVVCDAAFYERWARRLELARYGAEVPSASYPAEAPEKNQTQSPGTKQKTQNGARTLVIEHAVRSGQQIYARDRDLILLGDVNAGAEVAADGLVHVHGRLRGRCLAGASGDETARIFCRCFEAQLISIAGTYQVFEEHDPTWHGKSVRVEKQDKQLQIRGW